MGPLLSHSSLRAPVRRGRAATPLPAGAIRRGLHFAIRSSGGA